MMDELDEVWTQMINRALEKARADGRGDVAEYFKLKATNDKIRKASVEWLIGATTEIARFTNQNQANVAIENVNPHQFAFKNANLVGEAVRVRQGVRCLTVEAGWTRSPGDGFMRGNALAAARVSHFGMSKNNVELLLLKTDDFPNWFAVSDEGAKTPFDSRHLNRHFQIFLGE